MMQFRYKNGDDVVLIQVPWGEDSQWMPPPIVHFGDRGFVYSGPAAGAPPFADDEATPPDGTEPGGEP